VQLGGNTSMDGRTFRRRGPQPKVNAASAKAFVKVEISMVETGSDQVAHMYVVPFHKGSILESQTKTNLPTFYGGRVVVRNYSICSRN
jgi:hypothetical protein